MSDSNINIILKEAKELPDDLLKEVLDFVILLKNRNENAAEHSLYSLQQDELSHLEEEFVNYKKLYPNE